MDFLKRKPARKLLSDLLVEAGVCSADELPKGGEYSQKATDADFRAVQEVKELIREQGLSVPLALRALVLAKQRHGGLQGALSELGWRPRRAGAPIEAPPEAPADKSTGDRPIKSAFNPAELDQLGGGEGSMPRYATDLHRKTWTGIKVRPSREYEVPKDFLKADANAEVVNPTTAALEAVEKYLTGQEPALRADELFPAIEQAQAEIDGQQSAQAAGANAHQQAAATPAADAQQQAPILPTANGQQQAPAMPTANGQQQALAMPAANEQQQAPAMPAANEQQQAQAMPAANEQPDPDFAAPGFQQDSGHNEFASDFVPVEDDSWMAPPTPRAAEQFGSVPPQQAEPAQSQSGNVPPQPQAQFGNVPPQQAEPTQPQFGDVTPQPHAPSQAQFGNVPPQQAEPAQSNFGNVPPQQAGAAQPQFGSVPSQQTGPAQPQFVNVPPQQGAFEAPPAPIQPPPAQPAQPRFDESIPQLQSQSLTQPASEQAGGDDWSLRDDEIQAMRDPRIARARTGETELLSPELVNAMRDGDRAFDEKRFADADKFYSTALVALEQSPNRDLDIGELLIKMGRAMLGTNDYQRAEEYLVRALEIREKIFGRDDIAVAEVLDYLGELYEVQSQYMEAEHYYLGALGIKERMLKPGTPDIGRTLKKLVAVSKRRGVVPTEGKKSGELLTEAGLVDPAMLKEGLSIAQARDMPLGRALISLHYLTDQDLEAVLQAQLLLREGIIPSYLAVRALRLSSMQRIPLERALREIGLEPEDATHKSVFELLRAAQELLSAERQLAPEDPGLANLCMKVAEIYAEHQQFDQAEQLYRRALNIRERWKEVDSRDIADNLARLGDMLFKLRRYDEALEIYVRLLDLWETISGADDINFVNCLESLAAVHYVKADFKESGRLYQLSISGKERLLGKEHPSVASAVQGRANCFYAVKRYTDAEKFYRRALDMYQKVYGQNNPQSGVLLNVLGDLFYAQGLWEKALEEYAHGLAVLSNLTTPDVFTFANMLEKSAHCFGELQNLERADAYYQHLIKTREGFNTLNLPDMADVLDRYATVLEKLNRADEAMIMRARADEIRRPVRATQTRLRPVSRQ